MKFNLPMFKTHSLSQVKYESLSDEHGRNSCSECGQHVNSVGHHHSKSRLLICACIAFILGASLMMGINLYFLRRISGQRLDNPYAANELFGEIPIVETLFRENSDFVTSDPHDGAWSTPGVPESFKHTAWDDIFKGAWIEVPHPAEIGLSGGVPMHFFHRKQPSSPDGEAYVVSMLHQIHCLGELKHVFMEYERTQTITTLEHVTHCIEYLRQSVMCSADLTLERPQFLSNDSFKGSNGWDAVHRCRDWSTVHELLLSHKIT